MIGMGNKFGWICLHADAFYKHPHKQDEGAIPEELEMERVREKPQKNNHKIPKIVEISQF